MSMLTSLIPLPYRIIGVIAIGSMLLIGGKIFWDHEVQKAAAVVINKYVADKAAEEAQLSAIVIADNDKIKIQFVTETNTIIKTVKDNGGIIDTKVPDVNTILSDGWVSAFNSSTKGLAIDPIQASDKTPSGVNADQALDVINTNNGIAQENLNELTACQAWITKAQADVAATNKKAK